MVVRPWQMSIVVQEILEEEWKRLKFITFPTTLLEFAKKLPFNFYQQYSSAFPELWKLVQILLFTSLHRCMWVFFNECCKKQSSKFFLLNYYTLMVVSRKGRKWFVLKPWNSDILTILYLKDIFSSNYYTNTNWPWIHLLKAIIE